MKKALADHRMKWYKVICFAGVALLTWADKGALVSRLQFHHATPIICTIYFTVALVCMLLGITASSFPDSAPFATTIAWSGALQAFLSLNALFHLSIMEFYPELLHLATSFLLTSVLFSTYWFFCARDPKVTLVEATHHE